MNVDIGDRVAAGDVLATLEIPELQENLEKALALARRNEEETNRAAATYGEAHPGFQPARKHRQNKTTPDCSTGVGYGAGEGSFSGGSACGGAAGSRSVAGGSQKNSRRRVEYCKITAPFSGVITKRFADEGALVQGGVTPSASAMPLVRLSQNGPAEIGIPGIGFLRLPDQGRRSGGNSHSRLGANTDGAITRFAHKVETATRTMEAEVDVTNADLALIAGNLRLCGA